MSRCLSKIENRAMQVVLLSLFFFSGSCKHQARSAEQEESTVAGLFSSSSLATKEEIASYCPAQKTLFYHWGPSARILPWLKEIGYTGASGARLLNGAMMDKLIASSDPEAILGKGFYLADSPLASAQYGNQLLVVEIHTNAGESPCQRVSDENLTLFIRSHGDDKTNKTAKLPTLVAYRPVSFAEQEKQPVYYVLRHLPKKQDSLTVTIRLPAFEDVALATKEYRETMPTKYRDERGIDLKKALDVLGRFEDQSTGVTTEAQSFVRKFVFDGLLQHAPAMAKDPSNLNYLGYLCGQAKAYDPMGSAVQILLAIPSVICPH